MFIDSPRSEPDEGQTAVLGELDGQRARRRHRRQDPDAGQHRLLGELEGRSARDEQHRVGQRHAALAQSPAHHLVDSVVSTDVLSDADAPFRPAAAGPLRAGHRSWRTPSAAGGPAPGRPAAPRRERRRWTARVWRPSSPGRCSRCRTPRRHSRSARCAADPDRAAPRPRPGSRRRRCRCSYRPDRFRRSSAPAAPVPASTITCSLCKSPCTRSMSSPGVRMVTWKGRPARRISSGSSTATVSTVVSSSSAPIRTTRWRRVTRPMQASCQMSPRRRDETITTREREPWPS